MRKKVLEQKEQEQAAKISLKNVILDSDNEY
jgi:hypothetical protein